MVDGVAGVDLISLVLDSTPEPTPAVDDDWDPEPRPSSLRIVRDAVVTLATSPSEQLRTVRAAMRTPRRTLQHACDVARGLRSFGSAMRPTPTTSLDGSIGPHRRWSYATATLDDIRTIRQGIGGTVNDVVLAAVTRGYRDLALTRGEDPSALTLRTLVPVSVRAESARGLTDNRVSAIFFDLPVHVDDPLTRLTAVREEMGRLKRSHEPEAGEALTAFIGALPPALTARGTRVATRLLARVQQRSMNTVTTNVPGPQQTLYAAGRAMLEYLPFVPLGPGVRVGVAILSYDGQLAFGVTGDFDTAADIAVVGDGIEAEISMLVQLATASTVVPAQPTLVGG
jgi:diacylglycerol O-acyltransferase